MPTFLLYSKNFCPYCVAAKNLLKTKGFSFEEKDAMEHAEEFFALAEKHHHQTVPMIFMNGEFLGGFDQLKSLSDTGKL